MANLKEFEHVSSQYLFEVEKLIELKKLNLTTSKADLAEHLARAQEEQGKVLPHCTTSSANEGVDVKVRRSKRN